MVGHVTLYHPAILELKELLRRGDLGRPQYLYSNRLNSGRVRETENILWSFAPHDFAVLLYLLDASADRDPRRRLVAPERGRADVTVTHLKFPGGERAHIFVSWLHPMREHRLVVTGERRMAVFADDVARRLARRSTTSASASRESGPSSPSAARRRPARRRRSRSGSRSGTSSSASTAARSR